MIVPLQGLRDRAEDVVVPVLGPADDDDHRGAGPVAQAQFVGGRDQLVRDRAVAALEVPVLRGGSQVRGLQVRADFRGCSRATSCTPPLVTGTGA